MMNETFYMWITLLDVFAIPTITAYIIVYSAWSYSKKDPVLCESYSFKALLYNDQWG